MMQTRYLVAVGIVFIGGALFWVFSGETSSKNEAVLIPLENEVFSGSALLTLAPPTTSLRAEPEKKQVPTPAPATEKPTPITEKPTAQAPTAPVLEPAPHESTFPTKEYLAALEEMARLEIKNPKQPIVAGSIEPIVPTPEPEPKLESETVAPDVVTGPPTLRITAVKITGGTGKTKQDFVQIFNFGSSEVTLNGIRLVKRTKTGASDTSLKSWTTDVFIPAGGYYLWANSEYLGPEIPDSTTSGTISNDNGVALRLGKADEGDVLDSVAWGASTNSFIEGSVFPDNPGEGQVLQRVGNQDTNDNEVDFEITSL